MIALAVAFRAMSRRQIRRRSFLVLFFAGALSVLSMAPFHFWPMLCLTLPVLFWALEDVATHGRNGWRSAAWRGWAFGFGYHLAGLYWIGSAFLVQAERFAALMPFAISALTASLALFLAVAAVAYVLARPHLAGVPQRIVGIALIMMVVEWLRGHIFTGFPWNTLGYALTMPLPLMQWAGLFGIYVLTAITVVTLTAPLVVLATRRDQPLLTILGTTIAPLGLATAYGVWQLNTHPTEFQPNVRLRLVQPSFSQRDKFDQSKRGQIFLRHLELARQGFEPGSAIAPSDRPTHIVWPEAAIPFFVRRNRQALMAMDNALPDDVRIIAGTFRIDVPPNVPNERVGKFRAFNTAMAFGGDGKVKSFYDKIHLVPFGEYLPAQSLLSALGFENLTRTAGGLALGKAPRELMRIAGLPPVEMLICYEASFPNEVAQTHERPGLMINLTNDAWFGNTTGPYQHLHQTRLRAVEQGVAMLRSANTGISAIVDPMGRMLSSLALNDTGVIDSAMPRAVRTPIYGRHGRVIELAAVLLILAYLATCTLFRRKLTGRGINLMPLYAWKVFLRTGCSRLDDSPEHSAVAGTQN
ncbi:MAG: apolipoprotein N-acyltransferase [Hyphomicrobiaceae bacterium]